MKRSYTLFSEGAPELIQKMMSYSMHAYHDTEYIVTSSDPLFKASFDQLLQAKAGDVDQAKLSFFMESVDEDIMPFLNEQEIETSLRDEFRRGLQNCYCEALSCKGNGSEEPEKQMENNFTRAVRKMLDTVLDFSLKSENLNTIPKNR